MRRTTGWTAVLLLTLAGTSACGDDTDEAGAGGIPETAEQYGARMEAECPGGDPGFDPFLAEHPDPSAEDWAAFLPGPIAMLTTLVGCIEDSDPPGDLRAGVDAVVSAMRVVIDDLEHARAAAEAGDLAEAETWIAQMHDVDQPKIDQAVGALAIPAD